MLFLCLAGLTSFPQYYRGGPDCVESLAHKVDEFDFIDINRLRPRLKDIEDLLETKGNEAKAVVHIYGGRQSRSDDIPKLIEIVRKSSKLSELQLWIRDMGYRNRASLEIFLLPLPCTSYPSGVADLNIDEVELTDLPVASQPRFRVR